MAVAITWHRAGFVRAINMSPHPLFVIALVQTALIVTCGFLLVKLCGSIVPITDTQAILGPLTVGLSWLGMAGAGSKPPEA